MLWILSFVEELKTVDFEPINEEPDPDQSDALLLNVMMIAMNKCIPTKSVKLRINDKNLLPMN